jgi:ribosomal protein L5
VTGQHRGKVVDPTRERHAVREGEAIGSHVELRAHKVEQAVEAELR